MNKAKLKTLNFKEITFFRLEFYLVLAAMTALELFSISVIHQFIAGAGLILLPIYFFVLSGYLFFGPQAALGLSFLLPLASFLFNGMPAGAMLYAVSLKAFALCGFLFLFSRALEKKYWAFLLSLISYQIFGFMVLWLMGYPSAIIFSDVFNGYPGLILQGIMGMVSIKILNLRK